MSLGNDTSLPVREQARLSRMIGSFTRAADQFQTLQKTAAEKCREFALRVKEIVADRREQQHQRLTSSHEESPLLEDSAQEQQQE